MARNNLTWIKGDITGDIYYDLFKLESQDIQYLRCIFNGQGGLWGGRRVWAAGMCVWASRWPNWFMAICA